MTQLPMPISKRLFDALEFLLHQEYAKSFKKYDAEFTPEEVMRLHSEIPPTDEAIEDAFETDELRNLVKEWRNNLITIEVRQGLLDEFGTWKERFQRGWPPLGVNSSLGERLRKYRGYFTKDEFESMIETMKLTVDWVRPASTGYVANIWIEGKITNLATVFVTNRELSFKKPLPSQES